MKLICMSGTKDVSYGFLTSELKGITNAVMVDCECTKKHLALVKEDLYKSLDKYVDTDDTVVVITYNDVVFAMLREYATVNIFQVNFELMIYSSENDEGKRLFEMDGRGNIGYLKGVLDTWDDCIDNIFDLHCK